MHTHEYCNSRTKSPILKRKTVLESVIRPVKIHDGYDGYNGHDGHDGHYSHDGHDGHDGHDANDAHDGHEVHAGHHHDISLIR